MNDEDVAIRNVTYRQFAELGRAPTASEVAAEMHLTVEEAVAAWRRLHAGHALVIDPATDEIRMANPFAARPTPFRVDAAERAWFANCAWDAFGIGAALHVDSVIETDCADCREPIRVNVRDGMPDDDDMVFHVLVPAVSWWQDIGFT
ncbi:MAG TPA: organomercurial lyase [Candidatus Limnocylindrales bacterium]|jgi:hypothetical protein